MIQIQQLMDLKVVKKTFSLQQAEEILSIIYRFTLESNKQVLKLKQRLHLLPESNYEMKEKLKKMIQAEVDKWQEKIEKLGVQPRGVWMADFDNGLGYYCWKFPEKKILFAHAYQDGFSKRKDLNLNSLKIETI